MFPFGCPEKHFFKYEFYARKNIFVFHSHLELCAINGACIFTTDCFLCLDPACQFINVKDRCYKLDPDCPPETNRGCTDFHYNSANEMDSFNGYNFLIWLPTILGILMPMFFILALACYLKKLKERKGIWFFLTQINKIDSWISRNFKTESSLNDKI